MKPQPEIGDLSSRERKTSLLNLSAKKAWSRLRIIADSAMPFALFSLRVRWKLSKKTLCTTSNEPKTIVADENVIPITLAQFSS